jgi:predicted site-specific integrase-resolvase
VTIDDAAKRCGVSVRTVQRWITSGRLRTTVRVMERNWRHDIAIDDLIEAEASIVDACLERDAANGRR